MDRALDEAWTSGLSPELRASSEGGSLKLPLSLGPELFSIVERRENHKSYPLTQSGASPVVRRIDRPSPWTVAVGERVLCWGRRCSDPAGHPSGMALGIAFTRQLANAKRNPSSSPTRGRHGASCPRPCFRSNSTEGGSPGEGKGLERSHCISVQGPDFPGKGTGRSKFSLSQAGAQSQSNAGE